MLLTLTFTEGTVLLALVIASSLLAGLVVIWGRKHTPNQQQSSDQATPIIRSWIAISLVIGLLIFCAAAFMVSDTNLRSILLGGLVASVGSAVAFYFSSKSTDQAVSAVVALSQAGTPTNSCPVPLVGTVGQPYSYQFSANGLQSATFQFALGTTNQQLPPGLTLDTNGTLHGTPTAAGTYSFKVNASTAAGALFSQPVTILINAQI